MKLTTICLLVLSATSVALPAFAQEGSSPQQPHSATHVETNDVTFATVRKLDVENSKIKLKHEEIKNLGMPGMTMTFQVEDTSLFEGLAQGDNVHFKAEMKNGAFVITHIEKL